jgi:hypothetical protein
MFCHYFCLPFLYLFREQTRIGESDLILVVPEFIQKNRNGVLNPISSAQPQIVMIVTL